MAIPTDPITYSRDRILRVSDIDSTILELKYGGVDITGRKKNIGLEIEKDLALMCEDFNLLSGEIIDVEINKCIPIDLENKIYTVPASVRRNRDIRSFLSLRTGMGMPQYGGIIYGNSSSPVIDSLASMSNALSTPYTDGVAQVKKVDSNTFKITTNASILSTHNVVVVEIENREKLANIKPGSYPKFYQIAESYIKSCIYKNRIALKRVAIVGGHEITEIEGEINSYSDEPAKYDEYLNSGVVAKMLTYADEVKLHNFYSQQIKN